MQQMAEFALKFSETEMQAAFKVIKYQQNPLS
jgi:hypothetical protein